MGRLELWQSGAVVVLVAVVGLISAVGAYDVDDIPPYTTKWICGTQNWNTPSCWSAGVVPGESDVVLVSSTQAASVYLYNSGYEPFVTPPYVVAGLIVAGNGFVCAIEGLRFVATNFILVLNNSMVDIGYPTEVYTKNLAVYGGGTFQNDWGTFISIESVYLGSDDEGIGSGTMNLEGSANVSSIVVHQSSQLLYYPQFVAPFWYPNNVTVITNYGSTIYKNGTINSLQNFGSVVVSLVQAANIVFMESSDNSSITVGGGALLSITQPIVLRGSLTVGVNNLEFTSVSFELSTFVMNADSTMYLSGNSFYQVESSFLSQVSLLPNANLTVQTNLNAISLSLNDSVIGSQNSGGVSAKNVTITGNSELNTNIQCSDYFSADSSFVLNGNLTLGGTTNFIIPFNGEINVQTETESQIINNGQMTVSSSSSSVLSAPPPLSSTLNIYTSFENANLLLLSVQNGTTFFSQSFTQLSGGNTYLISGELVFAEQPNVQGGEFPTCTPSNNEYICH